MMPLQIGFAELIEPPELTMGLAIILATLFISIAYFGIRMRNAAILFFWALMIIVFVLIILIGLPFIWFWLVLMLTVMVIALAAIFRFVVEPMLKS